jgi:hypothetical protein
MDGIKGEERGGLFGGQRLWEEADGEVVSFRLVESNLD